jgi:hypothetical protein
MAGQQVTHLAPASTLMTPTRTQAATTPGAAPASVPGTSKQFEFAAPLATIEEFDPLAEVVREKAGILEVATITVKWDPSKLDEAGVRKILSDAGHAVK